MTAIGDALTRRQYAEQVAIRAAAVRDAKRLWATWTPGDRGAWRRLLDLAYPIVAARHAMSQASAARYFETLSALETGRIERAELGPVLPVEQLEKSLTSTGLAGVVIAKSRGKTTAEAGAVGFVRFSGAVSRLALNGGRDTILASVSRSSRARGYQRVTSGSACSFCAGLAGGLTSPTDFAAHDHCTCSAAPVFLGAA